MTEAKRPLLKGITGQDGSYLAKLLLDRGDDEMHGVISQTSTFNKVLI
jgi:GDPmannose 4,6-dehydratase